MEPIASNSKVVVAQNEFHMIRITPHGKMKGWIAFALSVFEEKHIPVVLHTLPVSSAAPEVASVPPAEPHAQDQPRPQQRGAVSNVITTIPRLISVVEIIKREYLKVLESKRSPRLEGLHQYNEIGCLEDLDLDLGGDKGDGVGERTRGDEIVQALSGRNHVKQKQTPYMKIILSELPLPDLAIKGATYQRPSVRKLSKSAKARAKKRARKDQIQNESASAGNAEDDDHAEEAEEEEDAVAPSIPPHGKKRMKLAVAGKAGC